MKKTVSFILVFSMIFAMFTGIFTVNAGAKVVTAAGNDWYGDELAVDVVAGTDGYNYMALFRKPAHGYEFAGHFIGDGEGAQTFVIIDTAKYDGQTWTPSGLYTPGVSNYEVVYCCDVETMIVDGTYYKRLNLEDSEYYGADAAAKIRTIVTNSYPYVTFEQMKADLAENGYPYVEDLTLTEVISAVQAAIWANANGMTAEDFRYVKSYRVTDNLQWGYPLHDVSNESKLDIAGNRKFKTYPEVGQRHDALVDYLLSLESTHVTAEEVVITNLDIVDYAPVQAKNGVYTVALKAAINNSGSSEADEISINIYVDDVLVSTTPVEMGKTSYDLTVEAKADQKITAEVAGTQFLPKGVYFYAPRPADVEDSNDGIATSREVSQNLVGVSMGATPIHSDASVTLDVPPEETPVTVDLVIRKIDESGKALSGATFALYTKKNDTGILVGQYEVNAQGIISIENLLAGDYVIKEIVTPAGYESLAGDISFTVSANGAINANSIPEGVRFSSADGAANIEVTNVKSKTSLGGIKYLDGEPAAGFTFELYELINESEVYIASATSGADGKFTFYVEYDTPATIHEYVIKEQKGSDASIIYDDSEFYATVFVDPMGVATVVNSDDVIFKNKTVSPAKVTISGEKYLDGKAADGFWFVLTDAYGNEIDRVQCSNGKFTFSKLTFDSAGTYKYFVSELAGNDENIIYDNNVFKVEIVVKKSGANYTATRILIGAEKIAFYNETVAPTEIKIEGTKYLDGILAEGFEFALIQDGEVISTATSNKNGKFYFTVDFAVAGDYSFQIVEIAGDDEMIVYDEAVYNVNVKVVVENGTLVATANDVEIVFNNETVPPTEYEFEGSKYLDGVPAAGFEFAILEGGEVISTATSDKNGKFYFTVDFAVVGDYSFQIVELAGDDEMIVYDDTVYNVDVEVVIENGTLVATSDDVEIVFNNQTVKPATVSFSGKNYLDLVLTGGFNFALKEGNNIIATASSDANGEFTLPTLTFNRNGVYVYEFVEIAGNVDTIVYDESVYTLIITVTLEGNELVADVEINYLDKSNPFINARGGVNAYEFSGLDFYNWTIRTNAKVEGTKYLDGKAAAGFEFALIDENNTVIATAQSDENGYFSFNFTLDATGRFNYSVVELAGTDANIIYDASVIGVSVTVTRVGIELNAEVATEREVVFNNQTIPETTEPETTEPEEIPEEPTPLDPTPETTEPEPETTEPEPETTTPEPETTEPEEEIPEEPTPLDPAPKTGDSNILIAVIAIASIALAVIYIKRRQVIED